MLRIITCLLKLVVIVCLACCQRDAVALEHDRMGRLSLENGLTGESANKVIKDYSGLIWIATSNGVCLFNGEKIVPIPIAPLDHGQRADRMVYDICEAGSDHSIYMATPDGIFRFSNERNLFQRVLPDMGKCQLTGYGAQLYIGNTQGLQVYEGGQLTRVDIGGESNVRAMTLDNEGTLYLLTSDALCRYVETDGRVERTKIADRFPSGVSFSALAKAGDIYYIGTKNCGLYSYSPDHGVSKIAVVGNVVNTLVTDRQGHVCVSTDGTGAFLIEGRSGRILKSFNASASTDAIDTDAVYYYWRDAGGNDWVCQAHFGLAYTYHDHGLFQTYRCGNFTTDGRMIRSFLFDGTRKLIGTLGGLYYVDEATGTVEHFGTPQLGGGNMVTGIERLGNYYYVGTYDAGLHRLHVSSLRMERVGRFDALEGEGTITVMEKSADNRLWIGTNTGVVIMDENEEMTYLTSHNSGIRGGAITSISFAPDGSRWIGGARGLSVMSANGDFLNEKVFPPGFFHHEGYLTGCFSEDGKLFVGNRNGIFFTDTRMKRFGRLELADRIIDETCHSLYCDKEAGLWITSEKGLFRFGIDGKRMIHFGDGMGIQSLHFLKGGICTVGDTLWVASPSGLKSMSLKQMWSFVENTDFRILLYDLTIGGERVPVSGVRNANLSNEVKVEWNFSSQPLVAKTVLNDYARPDGRLFEYRLDEHTEWHLCKNGEEMVFTDLFPGNHRLVVRLAGLTGTETTWQISVVPSMPFILEMWFAAVSLILLLVWIRYHRRTRTLLHERDDIADVLVEVESEVEEMREVQEMQPPVENGVKYERMRVSAEECRLIVERMNQYIEGEHAYRNADLMRGDIAEQLHVTVAKLSYVFSQYLKVSYYDYINRYRLEEFKRLVAEGEYQRYTIQALSERCGFKKSSFFSTFRKVEGMTPTEYLRQHKVRTGM